MEQPTPEPSDTQRFPVEKVRAFISHRHDDSRIAEVIANRLEDWGVKHEHIFRSTSPSSGVSQGGYLSDELQSELAQVNLLIFVYTFSDKDWSRCMWECGVAKGKSSVDTRTVVFQCCDDEPKIFEGRLLCRVDHQGIKSFTDQFHRRPGFIPMVGSEARAAVWPETRDDVIERRSRTLLEELAQVIPSRKIRDRHLWDFLRLRLESESASEAFALASKLDELKAQRHDTRAEEQSVKKAIVDILKERLSVVEPEVMGPERLTDAAIRQFGYQTYQAGMRLEAVINHWINLDNTGRTEWTDDLYASLTRAITNEQSPASSNYFKSVREGTDWWFFPALTRIRGLYDDSMEFDLYLIRVPSSSAPGGRASGRTDVVEEGDAARGLGQLPSA